MILFGIFSVLTLLGIACAISILKAIIQHRRSNASEISLEQYEKDQEEYKIKCKQHKKRMKEWRASGRKGKQPSAPIPPKSLSNDSSASFDSLFSCIIFTVIFATVAYCNNPFSQNDSTPARETTKVEQQANKPTEQPQTVNQPSKVQEQPQIDSEARKRVLLECWDRVYNADTAMIATVTNPIKEASNGLANGTVDPYGAAATFDMAYNNASGIVVNFLPGVPSGADEAATKKMKDAMSNYSLALSGYKETARILRDSAKDGYPSSKVSKARNVMNSSNEYRNQALNQFLSLASEYGVELKQ